jgi:hypothetical protein
MSVKLLATFSQPKKTIQYILKPLYDLVNDQLICTEFLPENSHEILLIFFPKFKILQLSSALEMHNISEINSRRGLEKMLD